MGNGINDCIELSPAEKNKVRDDPPFSVALKAESKLVGKESMKINAFSIKMGSQSFLYWLHRTAYSFRAWRKHSRRE